MQSHLDSFSERAAALFGSLNASKSDNAFNLRVPTRDEMEQGKDATPEHSLAEIAYPEPSPMTWKQIVEGTRNTQREEDSLREPSTAARQAFEDEPDYDEFDEVATATIQLGSAQKERARLNVEVIEEDDMDETRPPQRRRGVPRYLRYPHNYICYTLDAPITVGGGIAVSTEASENPSETAPKTEVVKETRDITREKKVIFRAPDKMETQADRSAKIKSSGNEVTSARLSFRDCINEDDSSIEDVTESAHQSPPATFKPKRRYRTSKSSRDDFAQHSSDVM